MEANQHSLPLVWLTMIGHRLLRTFPTDEWIVAMFGKHSTESQIHLCIEPYVQGC